MPPRRVRRVVAVYCFFWDHASPDPPVGHPPRFIAPAGGPPARVRPTAHHISGVQVPIQAEATGLVSKPNCVAVRRGGEQGGGELAARRRTNVMRRDGSASNRAEANLPKRSQPPQGGQRHGRNGADQDLDEIRGVGGGGTSGRCGAWTGDTCQHQCPATGADRDQRRHSTVEGGERRWREGRQEGRDVEDRTP